MKIPAITQYSVQELIDRNLFEHEYGLVEILDRFRNTVISRALAVKEGHIGKTAVALQISRATLDRWIQEHGLDDDKQRLG